MKEALKIALEALEELNETNSYWWMDVEEETVAKIEPAITAIKEALAQPAQEPNTISTEELIYMTGVYDGKVLERDACAVIADSMDSLQDGEIGKAIRARGNT